MEQEKPQEAAQGAEPAAPNPPPPELSPAACAQRLAGLFPALFGLDAAPRPVKLRIHADIQQRAPGQFSRKTLSLFLHRHTTGTAYLKALVTAPCRFDLEAQPAGDISEEHRQAAWQELERRRAVAVARRAVQAQARSPRAQTRTDAGPAGADAHLRPTGPVASAGPGGSEGAAQRPPRPGAHPRRKSPGGQGPARQKPPAQSRQPRARVANAANAADAADAADTTHATDAGDGSVLGDPGRRERATLLRTWEASPLTKANFCALKRITPAELDAQLELARQERGRGPSGPVARVA